MPKVSKNDWGTFWRILWAVTGSRLYIVSYPTLTTRSRGQGVSSTFDARNTHTVAIVLNRRRIKGTIKQVINKKWRIKYKSSGRTTDPEWHKQIINIPNKYRINIIGM
jgi:hypothetical protein